MWQRLPGVTLTHDPATNSVVEVPVWDWVTVREDNVAMPTLNQTNDLQAEGTHQTMREAVAALTDDQLQTLVGSVALASMQATLLMILTEAPEKVVRSLPEDMVNSVRTNYGR